MSNFLNVIDRIPTLPNRKKITHEDSNVEYVTMEYADEPLVDGTIINKSLFDKIEPVGSTIKYNIPDVEQIQSGDGYIRNLIIPDYARPKETFDRCLIATNNGITYEKISKVKNIQSDITAYSTSIVELSNGNYVVFFLYSNKLYYIITNSNFEPLQAQAERYTNLQSTQGVRAAILSNGEIMVVYPQSNTSLCYCDIWDSTFTNIIRTLTSSAYSCKQCYISTLSDGRAIIFWASGSDNTNYTLELYELSADHTTLTKFNKQHQGGYIDGGSACLLSNGNIAMTYKIKYSNRYYTYVGILNNTLTSQLYYMNIITADTYVSAKRSSIIDYGNNLVAISTTDGTTNNNGMLYLLNYDLTWPQGIGAGFNTNGSAANTYTQLVKSENDILFICSDAYNHIVYYVFDFNTKTFGSVKTIQGLDTNCIDANYDNANAINITADGSYIFSFCPGSTLIYKLKIVPNNPNAVLPPYSTGADQINGIDSTTIFTNDKIYEMVYNAVDNKWHELSSKEVIW